MCFVKDTSSDEHTSVYKRFQLVGSRLNLFQRAWKLSIFSFVQEWLS